MIQLNDASSNALCKAKTRTDEHLHEPQLLSDLLN